MVLNRYRAMRCPSQSSGTPTSFARASVGRSPHFQAPPPLRLSSIKLHSRPCTYHKQHNDSPIQAHRSHLALATLFAASAHPAIIDSPYTRSFLDHTKCSRHNPGQPYTRPIAKINHTDRRHRTSAVERAVSRRESRADNSAVVQLGRCSHRRDCNCTSTMMLYPRTQLTDPGRCNILPLQRRLFAKLKNRTLQPRHRHDTAGPSLPETARRRIEDCSFWRSVVVAVGAKSVYQQHRGDGQMGY